MLVLAKAAWKPGRDTGQTRQAGPCCPAGYSHGYEGDSLRCKMMLGPIG